MRLQLSNQLVRTDPSFGNKVEPTVESSAAPVLGPLFAGNYEIISWLATGGTSLVYEARHESTKDLVAIKVLQNNLVNQGNTFLRFQQEARAVSMLNHPNIVRVLEFGLTETDQPYLIMDYLEGISLAELIQREQHLSIDRALEIFLQIADALNHAHARGVVHRDIKPSNIMLVRQDGREDFVKIVDFGLAKLLTKEGEEQHSLTRTGDVIGSPLYMSPEQCMGQPLDGRSDIYSLGCVIYETLTGIPPFIGRTLLGTMQKHINQIASPLSVLDCDARLLAHMDALVFKALEKDAGKRYQNISDFGDALKRLRRASAEGRLTKPVTTDLVRKVRRSENWIKGHPLAFAAISVLAPLIMSGSVWAASAVLPQFIELKSPEKSINWKRLDDYSRPVPADFTTRERAYKEIIVRVQDREGKRSATLIEPLSGLTKLYLDCGKWDLAVPYLEQLIPIVERIDGSVSLARANGLNVLFDCYLRLGYCDNAHRIAYLHYMKSAKAMSTNNVSNATDATDAPKYYHPRRVAHACRTAAAIYEKLKGNDCVQNAICLSNAALLDEYARDKNRAVKTYLSAINIFRRNRNDHPAEAALALSRLADLEREAGDYEQSRDHFKEALALWQSLPAGKVNAALCLWHLGQCETRLGKLDESKPYYWQCLNLLGKVNRMDNHGSLPIMIDYIKVMENNGQWIDALHMEAHARNLL